MAVARQAQGAERRRFTVTEFERMVEAGVFRDDERLELIHGEILRMSRVWRRHVAAILRLNTFFSNAVARWALVHVQNPPQDGGPLHARAPSIATHVARGGRFTRPRPHSGGPVNTTRHPHPRLGAAPLRARRGLGFVLAAAALLAAPWPALAQQPAPPAVMAQLSAQGGSGVGGTATFSAAGDVAHAPRLEDATRVALDVRGLPAGASAQGAGHAGTCAAPGASAALLPGLTADGTGAATASGFVLFRGAENVAFSTIADGDHVVRITTGGRVVACGAIPRAPGAPSRLPATGGAPALGPLLGGVGLLLVGVEVARRRLAGGGPPRGG